MKHTPGPWQRFIYPEGGSRIFVEGEGAKLIADTYQIGDRDLIFAAPDMYEAIKEYLEWGPMTSSDRELHEAAFRAAISKAQGKEAGKSC
jgi:hypothetical protein